MLMYIKENITLEFFLNLDGKQLHNHLLKPSFIKIKLWHFSDCLNIQSEMSLVKRNLNTLDINKINFIKCTTCILQ